MMAKLVLQLVLLYTYVIMSHAGYFSRDDDDNLSSSEESVSGDGDFIDGVKSRVGVMIGLIFGILVIVSIIMGVILKMCSRGERSTPVIFTDVKIVRGENVEMVNAQYILPV